MPKSGRIEMNTDHIVFLTDSSTLHCGHCGDKYKINLPVPASIFGVIAKEYLRLHEHCKKPTEKP